MRVYASTRNGAPQAAPHARIAPDEQHVGQSHPRLLPARASPFSAWARVFLPVREGHPIFDCPFCHVPAHPGEKIGCCLTFGSHADAFALHEGARAHGYSTRISTTPRAIQASCGVALRVECGDVAHLEELARKERIDMEDIVPLPCQIDPRRDKYC